MALAKCPRTGKLFDKSQGPVHPDAMAEEEADYAKIRDYLAKKPNAAPEEVVEETGVSVACVRRMINQGMVKELDLKQLEQLHQEQLEREREQARRKNQVAQDIARVNKPPQEKPKSAGPVRSEFDKKRRTR